MTTQDLLSSLPDNLISHILSSLPTKDAARTCTLSKFWKGKWTSIFNIYISDTDFSPPWTIRATNFVEIMEVILRLTGDKVMKRFTVCCSYNRDITPRCILEWAYKVLERKVEILEIYAACEGVVFSDHLFDFKSLSVLKLILPASLKFAVKTWSSNLTTLTLAGIKIVNVSKPKTKGLVLNFPNLKKLKLKECTWSEVFCLDINSPALSYLKVKDHPDLDQLDNCRIKISGAKQLTKFVSDGTILRHFDLSQSSPLSASVGVLWRSMGGNDSRSMRRIGLYACLLLKGCSNIRALKVSNTVLEAIALTQNGPLLFAELKMVKQLEVSDAAVSGELLQFLHVTPTLERMRLNMDSWSGVFETDEVLVPPCVISHLKEVEFTGFEGLPAQVHLADYFVQYAVGLKKMSGLRRYPRCTTREACKRSEGEKQKQFWSKTKRAFEDGKLELGDSIKSMADFRRVLG